MIQCKMLSHMGRTTSGVCVPNLQLGPAGCLQRPLFSHPMGCKPFAARTKPNNKKLEDKNV